MYVYIYMYVCIYIYIYIYITCNILTVLFGAAPPWVRSLRRGGGGPGTGPWSGAPGRLVFLFVVVFMFILAFLVIDCMFFKT